MERMHPLLDSGTCLCVCVCVCVCVLGSERSLDKETKEEIHVSHVSHVVSYLITHLKCVCVCVCVLSVCVCSLSTSSFLEMYYLCKVRYLSPATRHLFSRSIWSAVSQPLDLIFRSTKQIKQ